MISGKIDAVWPYLLWCELACFVENAFLTNKPDAKTVKIQHYEDK
jgi:hypothetical protein